GRYDPALDQWRATSTGASVPEARGEHGAVWTGQEMIVWGGSSGASINTGGRYDPSADSWNGISTSANVPEARSFPTAVWTGSEMIVWGGFGNNAENHYLNSGARYLPSEDRWTPTSVGVNVPDGRYAHTAVWTGAHMIVWGGYRYDNGGYHSINGG